MEFINRIELKKRDEWRDWLHNYGSIEKYVWFTYFKKDSGIVGVSYNDAVEEAICFGWIDGKVRRLDHKRYMQRFTPRKKGSIWSLLNKNRAIKMIEMGLMTEKGLEEVDEAKKNGSWDKAYSSKTKLEIPKDVKNILKQNLKAWENFNAFTNSQKMGYIHWVNDAKKAETRSRRIKELLYRAGKDIKPGMN